MFDVSYKTMLELVEDMRELVKENPSENNMREMGRALLETHALRGPEDYENNELFLEAVSWFRRLSKEYPKEEYKEIVRKLETSIPFDQV